MNKANKAILFSTAVFSTAAFATLPVERICPFLSEIDVNDRSCRGYEGPCVIEPQYCCDRFVGYGGEAYCERGYGWEFIPLSVPMCPEDCDSLGPAGKGAARPRGTSTSSHDATTDSTHDRDTWSTDAFSSDPLDSWAKKREGTHDVWSDAATESWRDRTPDFFKTRDKASTSDRTKSTESLWDDNADGTSWTDRTGETWDDWKRERETLSDWEKKEWRDREATREGHKNDEEFGVVKFDKWGNPITSTGSRSDHKNRETTSDIWGRENIWGDKTEGSHTTDKRHAHTSEETTEHGPGWSKHNSHEKTDTGSHEATHTSTTGADGSSSSHSSTSTSTSSSTKTHSSSTWRGRRRATDGLAARLAGAEATVDVEPKLGDYVTQLLAPSAL